MTDATASPRDRSFERAGPMLAADGRPLKASLNRALRAQKLRALMLVAPLLLFVVITFLMPIFDMLFRSVENQIVSDTLPRTVAELRDWNPDSTEAPAEPVFVALQKDLLIAVEEKTHTRLGSRLNYEMSGLSSLFRRTGRDVDDVGEIDTDQFVDLNPAWEEPATWLSLMASEAWLTAQADWAALPDDERSGTAEPAFELSEAAQAALPETAALYGEFAEFVQSREDSPTEEEPWNFVYRALYADLRDNPDAGAAFGGETSRLLVEAAGAVGGFETVDVRATYIDIDEDWGDPETWRTIKTFSGPYTAGYFLNAVDMQATADGPELKPEKDRIYITLFIRTLVLSLIITFACFVLGYPIAHLLATLPLRTSNLVIILVLLPFWTSLLVRTASWKVLLQQQGVINDLLVWAGLISDAGRLVMINNATGTIIAMTHILLPFMILPLYSVMKTIPPSYVRAAKSLGATDWTAFWRVYFPQTIPGVGAGAILVFILSIGYYITPELVGGTSGIFISNRIAYHISSSLNWGLAAALATMLLVVVLVLYWTYDRIVGIDNVKLG